MWRCGAGSRAASEEQSKQQRLARVSREPKSIQSDAMIAYTPEERGKGRKEPSKREGAICRWTEAGA